ncbi:uncharacterized protein BYT42DRAFT_180960 [Radiomyces spectabilis]|uniref:uncharacterized protein n=1 Tax=Radiomyces spectabilis TaxID=64574 RepID=UPI00221EF886|nr:uncharacterized protein BYT42DRAFT_180960 [Radiomyces spectabilis]KAI8391068.1 hypothetical protein BYT42DRAFT_180960 [Radiomyces spectabilis]
MVCFADDSMDVEIEEVEHVSDEEGSDDETDHHAGEHTDDIHPDMQQFEITPQQYQQFRRKSIIPVDETVFNELSRHVSLDEVLNQAPTAPSTPGVSAANPN